MVKVSDVFWRSVRCVRGCLARFIDFEHTDESRAFLRAQMDLISRCGPCGGDFKGFILPKADNCRPD